MKHDLLILWYALGHEFCWVYRCPDEKQWFPFMVEK